MLPCLVPVDILASLNTLKIHFKNMFLLTYQWQTKNGIIQVAEVFIAHMSNYVELFVQLKLQ